MTYAMPFQKYVKTVLRVAASGSTRCITHIVVKQRADEDIGPLISHGHTVCCSPSRYFCFSNWIVRIAQAGRRSFISFLHSYML